MEAMVIGRAELEALQKRATDAETLLQATRGAHAAAVTRAMDAEIDLRQARFKAERNFEAAEYWRQQFDVAYAALRDLRGPPWWRRLWWAVTVRER